MEKVQCICVMRDLMKSLSELEARLEDVYGISLNEAMVLCSIGDDTIAAGDIIACTGLASSHVSKIIRSVEDKGLLLRKFGEKDKRQIFFTLTRKGKNCLDRIKKKGIDVPEWLAPLFVEHT